MKILESVLLVSFLLLLGRITGFIREWVIAYSVGADITSDFAMVLITLPDLMVSLLVGGGFAAAIVPEFKSLKPRDGYKLFKQLFFAVGAIFSLVAIFVSFFGITFIYVMAPGLPQKFAEDNLLLFWIVAFAIPLTACSGIVKAKMDTYNLFVYGAVGTLIFNLAIILLVLLPSRLNFIESIAFGILVGASVRLGVQAIGIIKIKLAVNGSATTDNEYKGVDKKLIRTIFTTITFSALLVLLPIIARSIASVNSEGALTLFTYAYRINEVPLALIVGSIVTVLLPTLSSMFELKAIEEVADLVITSIRGTILLCMAISIPIIFYASQLISLIFHSTKLTDANLESIATMVAISFFFLPFRSLLVLLFPILCCVHAAKNLGLISLIILSTLVISSVILTNSYGLIGTMLAYSITNLVGAILLCLLLIKSQGAKIFKEVFSDFKLCFLVPTIFSVLVNFIGHKYFSGAIPMLFFSCLSCIVFVVLVLKTDRRFDNSSIIFRAIK
ncbi:hypothetical protein N9395_06665 [Pseudomonadales bacterium]|nr:hypothetical protein [Pseudomonadales bacterium]